MTTDRDRWKPPDSTEAFQHASSGLCVSSCLCHRNSAVDICNMLLLWHCPDNCHTGLAVIQVTLLLLLLRSSHFSAPKRAAATLERQRCHGVSLSGKRLSPSLFLFRPQCNITPAAAYSKTLWCHNCPLPRLTWEWAAFRQCVVSHPSVFYAQFYQFRVNGGPLASVPALFWKKAGQITSPLPGNILRG